MVRIEKIEMQGFKSFAKKTQVFFPSNFSVVCGPNGSGKSNILDAICFALGRTSAKSMRADKMIGIIFSGSIHSQPAEQAKVSLHFDNSDKKFPVSDAKVEMSRRVNRAGVSIYKMNGKTVTRETMQEIFRKANIYPDGYNIILQGDVTEVIEMSPLARREILDEIAGIAEFDDKKEKSMRELTTVEERLKEQSIILGERETTLKKLETEKESAEKYSDWSKELDKLRASLAKKRLVQAEEAMKTLQERIGQREGEIKSSGGEFADIDKEIDGAEKELKSVGQKLFDRSKDIEVIREAERLRSDINVKSGQVSAQQSELLKLDDLISRLQYLNQRQMEGDLSPAVQEIVRLKKPGVFGTVASLSDVEDKYRTAIEVAAGNHFHDIVVSDQDTAIACVKHLKEKRVGRATFLPLDKIRERDASRLKDMLKKPGVIGLAIDLIKFDKKYWHAFSFVFGDTVVVDTIETARRLGIGEARFVTLDGDMAERSGAIIGGFYMKKKSLPETDDIKRYEKAKRDIQASVPALEADIAAMRSAFDRLTKEEHKGSAELVTMQAKREELERSIETLRRKRSELYGFKTTADDEINRLKLNRARLEAELENIKDEFQNYKDYETYDDIPIAKMQTDIKRLVTDIQTLGPVNQKAMGEYKDVKAVYKELKDKVDKLTSERNKVLEMMAEIEGKRRSSFLETLNAVADQFKIVFKDLTGWEGSLRLEGETLEESGLMIETSPPGRLSLNIDSMSGGEKTLTALAFLFAIQQFKPAPFYVLDEIDAALDKPNARKIIDLIRKYAAVAQFIVITHNDATIQAADSVYGVSMEEGESKLVGIRMPS